MITGSFNNWNVLALPAAPQFSSMTWSMHDSISATPSPWSGQAQILDWQVDRWEVTAALPQMTSAAAQPWIAFLAECRGMSSAFLFGDPLRRRPSGVAGGVPVVNGYNAPRANLLRVKGFVPSRVRVLLPGDQLQIGYRLHTVLERVDTDSGGFATISIWPRLRESPADGSPVILNNPRGLFRLADNKRSYSSAVTKLYAFGLTLTEAL